MTTKATALRGVRVPAAIAAADTVLAEGVRALLLRAGHRVTVVADPEPWLSLHRAGLCFVESESLGAMAQRHPDALLFAVESRPDVELYRRVIRAGGCGVVAPDMDAATVEALIGAVTAGMAVVPRVVARLLATRTVEPVPGLELSDEETRMLRMVGAGISVGELGDAIGLSARQTRRRLRRIYDALGAANRSQALVTAARLGLLEEP